MKALKSNSLCSNSKFIHFNIKCTIVLISFQYEGRIAQIIFILLINDIQTEVREFGGICILLEVWEELQQNDIEKLANVIKQFCKKLI